MLIQQILDFAGPFFHVKHRKPCAEFGNEPAHARIAKALVEAVGFEQVFGLAVSVSVNPANRTRSNPCADKCREDVTVLRATQQVTLILTGHATAIGAATRATESTVDEPARIAFDRHERRNDRRRIQKSHTAVYTIAMTEHILLNPGVTCFLKPVRILCAGVTVRHRVDSLVNHRIHLRHTIVVRATRIETVQRIKRGRHGRVARDPRLPTARSIFLRTTGTCPRAVVINGAVLAVLRLGIRRPAHLIVQILKVSIVLLENRINRHVGNAAVAILAPIEGPPLTSLLSGNARTIVIELGRWLNVAQIRFRIVIQVAAVAGPRVGITRRRVCVNT